MYPKISGHSADYVKRQARKLKKELGIPHHAALDKAAQNAGFSNWRSFINSRESSSVPSGIASQSSTLPFRTFPNIAIEQRRPDAKMPITAHQEAARLLKEVRASVFQCKSIEKPVGQVRCTLDDWIQMEYTSRIELPDEVFHGMYYGDSAYPVDRAISTEKKEQLIKNLQRVKQITSQHYPNCAPLRSLHKQIDRAIKALDQWYMRVTAARRNVISVSRGRELQPGTLIRLKSDNRQALVLRSSGGTVDFYWDWGAMMAARHEVAVSRNQSGAAKFKPIRLYVPYGKWTCADGTEVLFNRDYCPLWAKSPNGNVTALDPDAWIEFEKQQWFFDDVTAPAYNKKTLAACLSVLKEWGVEGKKPRLLDLLPEAIRVGDIDILKKKSIDKKFPMAA